MGDKVINIDGINFNAPLIKFTRSADFLDKYANRTESGTLERELIGVFYNYQLQLGMPPTPEEYDALWDKLTEPTEYHTVTVPDTMGTRTFTAYFSNVKDEMVKYKDAKGYFKGITVNYTSKAPTRT